MLVWIFSKSQAAQSVLCTLPASSPVISPLIDCCQAISLRRSVVEVVNMSGRAAKNKRELAEAGLRKVSKTLR